MKKVLWEYPGESEVADLGAKMIQTCTSPVALVVKISILEKCFSDFNVQIT